MIFKNFNFRSAHERLFGSKAGASAENNTEHQNSNNDAINNKHSSLERRQNSKSVSIYYFDFCKMAILCIKVGSTTILSNSNTYHLV